MGYDHQRDDNSAAGLCNLDEIPDDKFALVLRTFLLAVPMANLEISRQVVCENFLAIAT